MPDASGVGPWVPKKPTLAPATPAAPPSGNAIRSLPLSWHQMIVSALVVGISIWLIEQNVSSGYAMVLALIILLGAAFAIPGFTAELQAIVAGKA